MQRQRKIVRGVVSELVATLAQCVGLADCQSAGLHLQASQARTVMKGSRRRASWRKSAVHMTPSAMTKSFSRLRCSRTACAAGLSSSAARCATGTRSTCPGSLVAEKQPSAAKRQSSLMSSSLCRAGGSCSVTRGEGKGESRALHCEYRWLNRKGACAQGNSHTWARVSQQRPTCRARAPAQRRRPRG